MNINRSIGIQYVYCEVRHFGGRTLRQQRNTCPDTSAVVPMCLTDSSAWAVQPKYLVVM